MTSDTLLTGGMLVTSDVTSHVAGVCHFWARWHEWCSTQGIHHCRLRWSHCRGECSRAAEATPAGVGPLVV